MPVTFHCNHCGKKIEAPDNAGGKWGRCPACHNKVYVPKLDAAEELKLAPVDPMDIERQDKLMAETHHLTQDILLERNIPNDAITVSSPIPNVNEKELTKNIILYLRLMADGELDQAQQIADRIAPYRTKAKEVLDKIALSEIPEPELADVPPHVLSGLIRNLRTRIS